MKIVVASNNEGKIRELQQMLSSSNITVINQGEFDVPSVDETGKTFIENALIKARHAAMHAHLPALADDSGLVVSSLSGEPGIFSARYAGLRANSTDNIEKLLGKLKEKQDRSAYFYCALVFLAHVDDPTPLISLAKWSGQIANQPSGSHGFGYDPVFVVEEHQKTAAELPSELKNRISHRGQALTAMLNQIKDKVYECTLR